MLEHIEAILHGECGLRRDKKIIVGVSGGPDSLCLLDNLGKLGYPIAIAHFEHQLRPESKAEAAGLESNFKSSGVPFYLGTVDVRAYAKSSHFSIEQAARHLRYRFFFELARTLDAQAVAVGHTADDQVETVLMHLIRGAGLSGLKGMSYRTILKQYDQTIPLVRPLLDTWRNETEDYCRTQGLHPLHDQSNDLLDFFRNKVRHQLIPALETYNPKVRSAIWRSASTLGEDEEIIKDAVSSAWQKCVTRCEEQMIEFDPSDLRQYSPGMQRNILRKAVRRLEPEMEIDFDTLTTMCAFLEENSGSHQVTRSFGFITLPSDLKFFRDTDHYFLLGRQGQLPVEAWPQLSEGTGTIQIDIPCSLDLDQNWKLICEFHPLPAYELPDTIRSVDQFSAWLDADSLPENLELRPRRRGDRFQPLGMQVGTQKVSDFMVNEKLPVRARARWPLLCSGDTVVWIPGYRISHLYRITANSRRAVYLQLGQT